MAYARTNRSDRANKIYRRDICIIRGISKHPRDTSIFRRATPFAPDPYPAVLPVRYNTPVILRGNDSPRIRCASR